MTRRTLQTISLGLVIAACSKAPPTTAPSNTSTADRPATAKDATIDRLCKALEVCGQMQGLCDRPLGLSVWREGAGWMAKVVLGQTGETGKQVLIDLDKGTCDGKPATIPDVANGVTVDSVIAKARACASGPPWNGKTKNGTIDFQNPVVSRFPAAEGGPRYSVYLSDGGEKPFALDVDLATGKCSE